jgi:lipid A ethanolaminephosphotransferase
MIQTNLNESLDLLTFKQVIYFIVLGVLPALLIYMSKIQYLGFKKEFIAKIKIVFISLIVIIASILLFSKFYTSFAREHKPLRYTINPHYWIYSIGKYIKKTYNNSSKVLNKIGLDATIEPSNKAKKLVILVVGEASRADHFSLNGYRKKTNPLLEKEDIINFSNMFSCGTSTAHSVPCMFSKFTRDTFDYSKGVSYENVIDVLNHTKKVKILWRDNNSDSKGVALGIDYKDYKTSNTNTICIENECRDIGMLVGLDKIIKDNLNQNILIVLHQMGNHGPAYYKRSTRDFKKFTPECKTNQLEKCTQEQINNSYDNAILYTDYFLSKTINLLKKYDKIYQTAMIYMSDHGESLGENGIYLHGLPYFMAPDAQIHIGALVWFGEKTKQNINTDTIIKDKDKKYSHDNLFHTLLGIFNVKTKLYKQNMDIINDN